MTLQATSSELKTQAAAEIVAACVFPTGLQPPASSILLQMRERQQLLMI
jgi:hypothetical protein